MKKISGVFLTILLLAVWAPAQTAEINIQLNEQFFDSFLDAIFKNNNPPEFPLSLNNSKFKTQSTKSYVSSFAEDQNKVCAEKIRLQREIDGVRTAVRFRDGRILAPIAFSGTYSPPLVGCIDFSGVAETSIDLEFDKGRQTLFGRARVQNVNISGTGGLGSGVVARMVQSSIDKKINPIQILEMDKISFVVPIQNSNALQMKAVGIQTDVANGVLNVRISYEFQKAQ